MMPYHMVSPTFLTRALTLSQPRALRIIGFCFYSISLLLCSVMSDPSGLLFPWLPPQHAPRPLNHAAGDIINQGRPFLVTSFFCSLCVYGMKIWLVHFFSLCPLTHVFSHSQIFCPSSPLLSPLPTRLFLLLFLAFLPFSLQLIDTNGDAEEVAEAIAALTYTPTPVTVVATGYGYGTVSGSNAGIDSSEAPPRPLDCFYVADPREENVYLIRKYAAVSPAQRLYIIDWRMHFERVYISGNQTISKANVRFGSTNFVHQSGQHFAVSLVLIGDGMCVFPG
jgi:hypothetical protein